MTNDRVTRLPTPCHAKISVVGAGHVGATFAYALLLNGLAVEVVLADKDAARARSEALDLSQALPSRASARIRAGTLDDTVGSDLIVITAGLNQRHGETRLDLAGRNALVIREVAATFGAASPDAIMIVATNPVDVMTRLAQESSGFPAERVIGSGTTLDTARLKHLIGRHFGIDPGSVTAQMIGEHGDSAVPLWSMAQIGGIPLEQFAAAAGLVFNATVRDRLAEEVRSAAYAIIEGKGATYYAIASGLVRIVEAIVGDEHSLLTVSNPLGLGNGVLAFEDVWLSMPRIVGRAGILLSPVPELAANERSALDKSAEILRTAWNGVHR